MHFQTLKFVRMLLLIKIIFKVNMVLYLYLNKKNQSIFKDIKKMNPYTNMHELVEQFMLEISE
ncbi:hypothetical protein GCM10008906_23850 [Clostridium oceanicum]|uniref:Uncharacterized protein n=1 Tax=Clostridium oceanicum TaxID=1543 RepID=A0ABN1JKS5_9CLOT